MKKPELYYAHLEESKKLIIELADKVMLDDGDLELSNKFFSPLIQIGDNKILSEYLKDLTNVRLENYELLEPNKTLNEDYYNEILIFLQNTISERI